MKHLGKNTLRAALAEGLEPSKPRELDIWLGSWFKVFPKTSPFLIIHLIIAVTSHGRGETVLSPEYCS